MGDGAATSGSTATLLALAVTAVIAEVATMVPYLAAIGIITAEGPGFPSSAVLLAGYCFVMILPALVLTFGCIVARSALEDPLARLDHWLTKHAQSTTAWVIGIVGAILALRAVYSLGWIGDDARTRTVDLDSHGCCPAPLPVEEHNDRLSLRSSGHQAHIRRRGDPVRGLAWRVCRNRPGRFACDRE